MLNKIILTGVEVVIYIVTPNNVNWSGGVTESQHYVLLMWSGC